MTIYRILIALTCVVMAMPGPAIAQVEPSLTLKVGYNAFESAEYVADDSSTFEGIHDYLRAVARKSRNSPVAGVAAVPLDFQLSVGNYYQVYEWFRNGDIDAAVVSPFTAGLLRNQRLAVPVVEFSEYGNASGQCPLIMGRIGGDTDVDPVKLYRDFVREVLLRVRELIRISKLNESAIRDDDLVVSMRKEYDVGFVTHLSSSGFIAPIMFAASWMENEKRRNEVTPKEEELFWTTLLNVADFTLFHGSKIQRKAKSVLRFSYSGRTPEKLTDARKGYSYWHAYDLGDATKAGHPVPDSIEPTERPAICGQIDVSIPNDVLVIRRDHDLIELYGDDDIDIPFLIDRPKDIFDGDSGYRDVTHYRYPRHRMFWERTTPLFSMLDRFPRLNNVYTRWYIDGQFQFRLNELLDILKQDQKNHNADLSLVLPGGGVKSLYQTVIIDKLYNDCRLRNAHADSDGCDTEKMLRVDNVIGTSGGAMVGMLVAHQTPDIEIVFREAVGSGLFALWDFPRWASIILLCIVFTTVLAFFRMPQTSPFHFEVAYADRHRVPGRIVAFVLAVFILTPIAVRFMRIEESGSIPMIEGLLYFLLGSMCHLALTCLGERQPGNTADDNVRVYQDEVGSIALVVMALICYVSAGLGNAFLDRDPLDDSGRRVFAILIMLSSIFLIAALFRRTAEPNSRLRLLRFREYKHSLALFWSYVVTCYVVVTVLFFMGKTSLLELTPDFWKSLFLVSLVVAVALMTYGSLRRGRIQSAIAYLGTRFFRESFRFSMLGRLLVLVTLGYLIWLLFVTPALYSSDYAWKKFTDASNSINSELSANLVVTGALLQKQGQLEEGDLYFCFPFHGSVDCQNDGNTRWIELPGIRAEMLDPVFASGAPFPVFPPHLVVTEDHGPLPIVDGGFAHNVPLEAASLLGSRQVLIIHSSPLPDARSPVEPTSEILSQFIRYSGRIFPFLFERAQEVDQRIARSMIVASLAPVLKPGEPPFPILTSFTDPTMKRMVDVALRDIKEDRRIGTFEYWGLPILKGVIVDDRRTGQ